MNANKLDFENSRGSVNKKERESISDRFGMTTNKLFEHIQHVLQQGMDNNINDSLGLAVLIYDRVIHLDSRVIIRKKLILEANGKPICYLCGYLIPLDIDINDAAAFSIDHVNRRADGGFTKIENCKSAHRLCNSARQYEEKNKNKIGVNLRTLNKIRLMQDEIEHPKKYEDVIKKIETSIQDCIKKNHTFGNSLSAQKLDKYLEEHKDEEKSEMHKIFINEIINKLHSQIDQIDVILNKSLQEELKKTVYERIIKLVKKNNLPKELENNFIDYLNIIYVKKQRKENRTKKIEHRIK